MNISLEQAKELAAVAEEKGVELLESQYVWNRYYPSLPKLRPFKESPNGLVVAFAYTAGELLEMTPTGGFLIKGNPDGSFDDSVIKYAAQLREAKGIHESGEYFNTPQGALCDLLIYLIKNDLYK